MGGMPPEENPEANRARREPLHELAEALTAIQNYARAAQNLASRQHSEANPELVNSLERLAEGARRAVRVLRHLQASIRAADPGERKK